MTNKKFKVAAMSMALTACVAAQPLIANAAGDVDTVEKNNDSSAEQTQNAETSTQSETSEESKQEENKTEAPVNNEAPADKQTPAFGPETDSSKVEIDYKDSEKDPDNDNITISKGDVIDTSKKDEAQEQDKADDKKDESKEQDKTDDKKDESKEQDKADDKKDESKEQDKTEDKKNETDDKKNETDDKKNETDDKKNETDDKKNETDDKKDESKEQDKTDDKKDEIPGKIGDATKKETETGSSTEVTPSTNPGDVLGKTEDGKNAIVKGTETTTTTGKGEAESKTETSTTTKGDKIDLDHELGKDRKNLTWSTDQGDKLNGYEVSGVTKSDDNSKQLTLTKTDKTEGKMSAEEIAKLLDVKDLKTSEDEEGNKTYTLTRTEDVLDNDGNKIGTRTTYYKVIRDSVTITTDTTLTIKMEKATAEGSEDLPATEIVLPSINDKVTGKEIISAKDLETLLKDQKADENGTYTIKQDKDGKTYELVIRKSTVGEGTTLTIDEQLAKRLEGNKDYSYQNGKFYYKGAELSNTQVTAVRNTLLYDVTITEITKNPDQVAGGGSISDAQQKAEEKVKPEAVKNALQEAAKKYDITLTDEELANVNVEKGGTLTVKRDGKTYTFTYEGATVKSKDDPITDTDKVDGKDAENVKDTTVTGTAFVTSGSKSWKSTTPVDSSKNQSVLKNDYTKLPDGMTADEGTETKTDGKGRITRFVSGGVEYTFTYEDNVELTQAEKDALVQEGISPDITSNITRVTWKSTKLSQTTEDSKKDFVLSDAIQKKDDNTYTITVNGETYSGFTKSDDGTTYTKTEGNKTTTITVSNGTLGDEIVKQKLTQEYQNKYPVNGEIHLGTDATGKFATWTDQNGNTVKVRYSDSYAQSFTVKETTKTSQSTEGSVMGTYTEQLVSQVQGKMEKLDAGDQLILKGNGKSYTITKTADGKFTISDGTSSKDTTLEDAVSNAAVTKLTEIIKSSYSTSGLDYSKLKPEDIWNLLDIQQQYADGNRNAYTNNKGCDSYWPEQGYENIDGNRGNSNGSYGEGVNTSPWSKTTQFGSLRLDAEVSLDDGKGGTIAGLILSDDLKFEYGHKEQIAGYVDTNKYPDKDSYGKPYTNKDELHKVTSPATADLSKDLTKTTGLVWNNERKGYDQTTKLIYDYGTTSNNSFNGKRFYNVSGKVAYDKAGTYATEQDATNALNDLITENPHARVVAQPNKQTGKTEYVVYKNVSELNAIGYMTTTANTNAGANSSGSRSYWTPGSGAYWGSNQLAGYDLRLQGLKLVNGKAQGDYGVEMRVDLTTVKNSTNISTSTGTNDTLKVNNCITTTPDTKTDEGTDRFGSYTANYSKTDNWDKNTENQVKGESSAPYRTFTELVKRIFHGTGETTQDDAGKFTYTYRTEENASATAVSKVEESTTVAHVDYNYTTVTTKDTIVLVPVDDDGGDDEIIEENTPDSPVLPGNPELPPVQDAKPDAPVLPSDPVLPPVQDAHIDAALPQTGVNWLTAIGLALSGMTLMITGAFASLTGKNAKH